MRLTKEQKGITLIVLVITIIVLLILAGVALATLTGNGSIIDNANYAVEEYNKSANSDQNVLNQVENLFAKYMGGNNSAGDDDDDNTPTPTPSVDANGYATAPYTVVANATNHIQITIPTGFAPAILNGSDSTTSSPGQDGSVKSVMPANQWDNITEAQINSGIVIVNSAGEEFVWVPIPNSSNFARTAWTTAYGRDAYGHYVDGTGATPALANSSTENAYWEDTTTTEYTNMVSSVNTNKGFYISRYESSQGTGNVAQSKRGVIPWVNMNPIEAITASSTNTIANTHLMYGIEWDSVLNWLIGHATIGTSTSGQTKTMEISDVQTDSTSWGNYQNTTGDAATNNGTLRATAYNEYWKANNIYDLAGNIGEWTQEKYSIDDERVIRSGPYDGLGTIDPAAVRVPDFEYSTDIDWRFPFQLLLVALKTDRNKFLSV